MKILAFDFETANSSRSSVCALGLAVVDGVKIVERQSWLVRPEPLVFDWYNTHIHGISETKVADKPEFGDVWTEVCRSWKDCLLVAHNASFDISVLRHVLDQYSLSYPENEYCCTRLVARRVWPKLMNYGLKTVSECLGFSFRHHDAEEDAVACATVALRACEQVGLSGLREVAESVGVSFGRIYPGGYIPCSSARVDFDSGTRRKSRSPSKIKPASTSFDTSNPFYGKAVVFTGTLESMAREEAMQKVVDLGGQCASTVSKQSAFLILGDQDFTKLKGHTKSSKQRKAESLIEKGADLEIICESEFLQMIGEP